MTDWTTGICKANGIDVHYTRTGGNKPPIVLLHGLLTKGSCWNHLAHALQTEYDVIMPDARGHGNSSAPSEGYRYNTLAADVVCFIKELKLDAPVLLGHSMGGMTAAVVASSYPQYVRGLVLADPTFLTPERQREVYESDVVSQHREIINQPKTELFNKMQSRQNRRAPEIDELFVQARFQTSIHAFEILTPPNPDYTSLIDSIDIPTLLVIGGCEAIVSSNVASELAKRNPHLTVMQILEASHGIPYSHPERFSHIVQTFLHSLSDRR